jgi:aspartate/methionine/tyrosine aminotransferase
MFSRRTPGDLQPNRLASALAARRRRGAEILDLTESNPTAVGIPYPQDILAPLADASARLYQPSPKGALAAREAVAADYARRGVRVGADRVLLTASTSEAYAFLFKLLCDAGDAVLVPRPGYPLFDLLARLESIEVASYPLRYDGEWHLAASAVEAALSPRTRAVVVVSPNNPTGSYLKSDEAAPLQELCARRGIALIADEVFADYAFGSDPRRLPSLLGDGPALAFALGGLSKACGLPQLKLGWIAAGGPASLRDEALARLELVADTFLSVGTPAQIAAPSLLGRVAELHGPIAARVRANLASLEEGLRRAPSVTLLRPEGGWYAVVRVPANVSEEDLVLRLLESRGVLVHPGYFFDFPDEAFLVLSLLPPEPAFRAGVRAVLEEASVL